MRRMNWLAFVITLFALAGSAQSTTVAWESAESLCHKADGIVRGAVTETTTRWHKGLIVTDVTLKVSRSFKGAQQSIVVVTQPGGSLDGQTLRVPGAPSWRVGREVIVFLEHRGGLWVEVALGSSAWSIDADGIATRRMGEVLVRGLPAHGRRVHDVPVSRFEKEILAYLEMRRP